jgi:iron complex transport system ATP-binding protein
MLELDQLEFHTLIKRISLKFLPGRLYAILGPNGSGKSTLFKTMAKIWRPTFGQVYWKGGALHKMERREISRTLSLVPQEVQIHFDFTVREVVEMGRYVHKKTCAHCLEHALKTVDAWHLIERKITQLSLGERQRVYIARALMTESPILLLDEPSSNLDVKHQIEIWQLLQTLKSQDKIVIVATHDVAGVKRFCDDVAILNQGVCIIQGATFEIVTNQLLNDVFGVEEQNGQFVLSS